MQARAVVCGNNTGRCSAASTLLAAALTACAADVEDAGARRESTAETAQEIKGGYPDEGSRAVTGLVIADKDGRISRTCSSALIAPNLVLTAQHCVAEAPKLISCKTATFGEPAAPTQVYVTLGRSLWAAESPWVGAREVLRPPDGNAVCGRDIALVVLAAPFDSGEVTPLAPRLVQAPEVGEIYSAVGFGDTEGNARDGGVRRRRDGLCVECVGYGCGAAERVAGSEWRGETGICNGDSGGPALDSAGRIMGVTSRGPAGCSDPIYGGLIAHADWLVSEARRAAELGGYPTPSWASASAWAGRLPSRRPDVDERWASCAHLPSPVGADETSAAAASALALLVLLARRRAAQT